MSPGRSNSKANHTWLALDDKDRVLGGDGLDQFGQPVWDDRCAVGVVDPRARPIGIEAPLPELLDGLAVFLDQRSIGELISNAIDDEGNVAGRVVIFVTCRNHGAGVIGNLPLRPRMAV